MAACVQSESDSDTSNFTEYVVRSYRKHVRQQREEPNFTEELLDGWRDHVRQQIVANNSRDAEYTASKDLSGSNNAHGGNDPNLRHPCSKAATSSEGHAGRPEKEQMRIVAKQRPHPYVRSQGSSSTEAPKHSTVTDVSAITPSPNAGRRRTMTSNDFLLDRPSPPSAQNCVSSRISLSNRAGAVVAHAVAVVTKLLEFSKGLAVFKIGLTRCASTRWENPKYGYVKDLDNYTAMIVLAESSSGQSMGFLEAALISQFSGTPGFRNIATGGETIAPDDTGPFCVYLVYRILKQRP
jgi:hypothetical protein